MSKYNDNFTFAGWLLLASAIAAGIAISYMGFTSYEWAKEQWNQAKKGPK